MPYSANACLFNYREIRVKGETLQEPNIYTTESGGMNSSHCHHIKLSITGILIISVNPYVKFNSTFSIAYSHIYLCIIIGVLAK